MNYNIPFIHFFFALRNRTFTVTIVIFILAFLLLFCWLIETDLRKENFQLGFSLIWVIFSVVVVFFWFIGKQQQRQRWIEENGRKKKSKSNQSLLQFVSFSRFFHFQRFLSGCQKFFPSHLRRSRRTLKCEGKKHVRTFITFLSFGLFIFQP